jgi:hypothetical protein
MTPDEQLTEMDVRLIQEQNAELSTLRAELEKAREERDKMKEYYRAQWERKVESAESLIATLTRERDETEHLVRNICLLFGFDPSGSDGTHGDILDLITTLRDKAIAERYEARTDRDQTRVALENWRNEALTLSKNRASLQARVKELEERLRKAGEDLAEECEAQRQEDIQAHDNQRIADISL